MGSGSKFSDPENPTVMVQVGASGSTGVLEISDMLFKTQGPGKYISDAYCRNQLREFAAGGAIIIEWNVRDPPGNQAAAGMWDSHIVLGGGKPSRLSD